MSCQWRSGTCSQWTQNRAGEALIDGVVGKRQPCSAFLEHSVAPLPTCQSTPALILISATLTCRAGVPWNREEPVWNISSTPGKLVESGRRGNHPLLCPGPACPAPPLPTPEKDT